MARVTPPKLILSLIGLVIVVGSVVASIVNPPQLEYLALTIVGLVLIFVGTGT